MDDVKRRILSTFNGEWWFFHFLPPIIRCSTQSMSLITLNIIPIGPVLQPLKEELHKLD